MKITLITEYDLSDRDTYSGTAYWIPAALKSAGIELDCLQVTLPEKLLPPLEEAALRCKQFFSRWSKDGYFKPEILTRRAEYIAETLKARVANLDSDVILTALTPLSAAYLQAKQPIVYWSDFIYSALAGFYPDRRLHHVDIRWDGHLVTDACLMNAKLLIFSSHWAARAAVELHGITKNKIHVIPFGPNIEVDHDEEVIKSFIQQRKSNTIKLLFIGTDWFRKGGDIVLNTAKRLHEMGHDVEVTLVGSKPRDEVLPPYVNYIRFLSKNTPFGLQKIKELYRQSHFLFVPSRAEAFGIVFCEASAFGLPSITTYVGGIGDVVKDGVNGMTFSLETQIDEVCSYIVSTLNDADKYAALCLSSFNEYKTRLNWETAGRQVKELIQGYLG
jgi:glycosyltransferase involved in cell wall biosynthesis